MSLSLPTYFRSVPDKVWFMYLMQMKGESERLNCQVTPPSAKGFKKWANASASLMRSLMPHSSTTATITYRRRCRAATAGPRPPRRPHEAPQRRSAPKAPAAGGASGKVEVSQVCQVDKEKNLTTKKHVIHTVQGPRQLTASNSRAKYSDLAN